MYEGTEAEIYDLVNEGRGKDYAGESRLVIDLIRAHRPDAASLLDVACGTGLHLGHFRAEFDRVAGLELSADMLDIARRRLPDVPFHLGDMRDFDLGDAKFDAVTCMFSSIGHMADVAELRAAMTCLARHTVPGGVAVIEPWWFPEAYHPGVAADVARTERRSVARVSHSSWHE